MGVRRCIKTCSIGDNIIFGTCPIFYYRTQFERTMYKDVRGQVTYIRIDRDGCSKNLIFLSHPLKPVSVRRSLDGVIQVKAVFGD